MPRETINLPLNHFDPATTGVDKDALRAFASDELSTAETTITNQIAAFRQTQTLNILRSNLSAADQTRFDNALQNIERIGQHAGEWERDNFSLSTRLSDGRETYNAYIEDKALEYNTGDDTNNYYEGLKNRHDQAMGVAEFFQEYSQHTQRYLREITDTDKDNAAWFLSEKIKAHQNELSNPQGIAALLQNNTFTQEEIQAIQQAGLLNNIGTQGWDVSVFETAVPLLEQLWIDEIIEMGETDTAAEIYNKAYDVYQRRLQAQQGQGGQQPQPNQPGGGNQPHGPQAGGPAGGQGQQPGHGQQPAGQPHQHRPGPIAGGPHNLNVQPNPNRTITAQEQQLIDDLNDNTGDWLRARHTERSVLRKLARNFFHPGRAHRETQAARNGMLHARAALIAFRLQNPDLVNQVQDWADQAQVDAYRQQSSALAAAEIGRHLQDVAVRECDMNNGGGIARMLSAIYRHPVRRALLGVGSSILLGAGIATGNIPLIAVAGAARLGLGAMGIEGIEHALQDRHSSRHGARRAANPAAFNSGDRSMTDLSHRIASFYEDRTRKNQGMSQTELDLSRRFVELSQERFQNRLMWRMANVNQNNPQIDWMDLYESTRHAADAEAIEKDQSVWWHRNAATTRWAAAGVLSAFMLRPVSDIVLPHIGGGIDSVIRHVDSPFTGRPIGLPWGPSHYDHIYYSDPDALAQLNLNNPNVSYLHGWSQGQVFARDYHIGDGSHALSVDQGQQARQIWGGDLTRPSTNPALNLRVDNLERAVRIANIDQASKIFAPGSNDLLLHNVPINVPIGYGDTSLSSVGYPVPH